MIAPAKRRGGLASWLHQTMFGYDVAESNGKRRQPSSSLKTEDSELTSDKRRQAIASARDVARNFAIASWAIRKHLDFVSRFTFQAKTGEDSLDDQLEGLMGEWSIPENCDIGGRHSLDRWLRIFEARAFVDGDIPAVKLRSGHLQAIEAERLRTPVGGTERGDSDDAGWVQGIWCDRANRALKYAIHRREAGGMVLEREVPRENVIHHGYFDRFDQVRGISPMAPAVNDLVDVYENIGYAKAKAKISQLFALAFYRDAEEAAAPTVETEEDDEDTEATNESKYDVDFGKGPIKLELEPGDRAEFLESKQPSEQFQAFMQAVIQIALKALDIPFCFFDESHTNFYGSRAAVVLYIESCKAKRKALQQVLREITVWRMSQWMLDGKLILPAGTRVDRIPFEWVHAGLPWWDPSKEINADLQAIKGRIRSRQEIRKERFGDDWFDVAKQLKREADYLEELGLPDEAELLQPVASTKEDSDAGA